MGEFTAVPKNAFDEMQLDAGVLLNNFSPASPSISDSDIICATTGGISISCVPEFEDLAEDVDNAPNGLMEFKKLSSWECTVSTTSLGTSEDVLQLALGASDVGNDGAVVPRRDVKLTDFKDIWWVGDRADGGFVACKIINALSTGGLTLQTTKNGKGTIGLELMGHVSLEDQTTMPMEFYVAEGEDES